MCRVQTYKRGMFELQCALCQFWQRLCLVLINTCWQGEGGWSGLGLETLISLLDHPPPNLYEVGFWTSSGVGDSDKVMNSSGHQKMLNCRKSLAILNWAPEVRREPLMDVIQRSTRVTFSTLRREWEFLLFNLAHRDETRIFWHLIAGFERSSKLLTFPELSNLNNLTMESPFLKCVGAIWALPK